MRGLGNGWRYRGSLILRGVARSAPLDWAFTLHQNPGSNWPECTGGFAITDTNAPAPQIQQFLCKNALYYLVGYQPSESRTNGTFHKVEVKVGRPDVSVCTRKGDVEPTGVAKSKTVPAKAKLEDVSAIEGLLPEGDIGLKVHAVPCATTAGLGACRNGCAWLPPAEHHDDWR